MIIKYDRNLTFEDEFITEHGKQEPEDRKTLMRDAKEVRYKDTMEVKAGNMVTMISIRALISNYSKEDFVVRYMLKKHFRSAIQQWQQDLGILSISTC